MIDNKHCYSKYELLRASERSERSEHTVVLSLTFLSTYLYIQVKKKAFKINAKNAKIKDVGLNED